MQTAGSAIRGIAEFGAGMQLGQHHFHAGELGFRLHVHRNASAIVRHFNGTIVMQGHDDVVAGSRKSLIDGLVDDLPTGSAQALLSVVPMYMPGRLRTASKPSSTVRLSAP